VKNLNMLKEQEGTLNTSMKSNRPENELVKRPEVVFASLFISDSVELVSVHESLVGHGVVTIAMGLLQKKNVSTPEMGVGWSC